MSRSGYSDDCDNWALIRWRGAVNSAVRGERGQRLLRELKAALEAMPVRELIADEFVADGQFCALGVLGALRGMDLSKLDPDDRHGVAQAFGVAEALAAEVMYLNDETAFDYWNKPKTAEELAAWYTRDRQKRWERVYNWVKGAIREEDAARAG